MYIATRLLLPFTGDINDLAVSYAVQMAEQRHATLVPCALILVKTGKNARLEHIQQAQDFLELARRKAQRQGVPIEPARLYTHDVARSIEAVAGEMNCEAILLFLCNTREALLSHAEIRELMDRAAFNLHLVLLPEKRGRRIVDHPLHMPFPKPSEEALNSHLGKRPQKQTEENTLLLRQMTRQGNVGR